MNAVLGTYRDGQVILDSEVDWPNGASLEVRLGSSADTTAQGVRDREERCVDGSRPPSTPEEIEEWLAWFDSRERLNLSPEEQERIEQYRQAEKQVQIELMRQNWTEVEKLF